jgi:2'-hydroxyisoflavone reductase
MSGQAANVRAGLIVGRYDPTGRFTYWVHRVARGGEVLVPESIDQLIQFIDVRDLALWLLHLARNRVAGTFNAAGPATMRAVLETARDVTGSNAGFTEVEASFLVDRELTRWGDFPLWLGGGGPEFTHFFGADVSRAVAAELTFRSLAETVDDTLANAAPVEAMGISRDREAELLAAWHAR